MPRKRLGPAGVNNFSRRQCIETGIERAKSAGDQERLEKCPIDTKVDEYHRSWFGQGLRGLRLNRWRRIREVGEPLCGSKAGGGELVRCGLRAADELFGTISRDYRTTIHYS